ncbi:glycosyltransferase family 2 protein, partial [Clostridium saudiense]|nr:glycosyltransferase family 2 protein [Clostridium saudiense]
MTNVKVSIILSAYNEKEVWFRKAVESILSQSYREFELI